MDPQRGRNGAETDLKRTETDLIKLSGVGPGWGGVVGIWEGRGVVREKENHNSKRMIDSLGNNL